MSQLKATEPYVPPLQRTEGQPSHFAVHGGLSYLALCREK
jgi:hypothetical protein